MSGDHAKREMETGDKPTTSHGKASSEESRNKGKKMRKVVYYETDTSSPSTSGSDAPSVTSKRHERKKYSKIPLRYPRISKRTPLLSVPLGKPPVFDGEDLSAFRDRGVPEPTSECRRVPRPRWVEREGEREGGRARRSETGVREVGIPRPSCSSRAQVGCACSRGLQASTRERERAASSERLSRPRPRAANPL
jgi:hypothetical protein